MQVDAVPAQVTFSMMGADATIDLSAGGFAVGIAEVTSWLIRILFVIVLLVNTPKFVFAMPSKGS